MQNNKFNPNYAEFASVIEAALAEDIPDLDITSSLIEDCEVNFTINAREDMVLCGIPLISQILDEYDIDYKVQYEEGDLIHKGFKIISGTGSLYNVFAVERTVLNFLQHMCGIATLTKQFVDLVKGTNVKILDTRKTLPGLRAVQKYAVRVGGGYNHRFSLSDGVLIKDNHIAMSNIEDLIKRAKMLTPSLTKIEVECDTIEQVKEAMKHDPDIIMLDNMSVDQIKEAVKLVAKRIKLEVSGGVSLENVKEIAKTGVDYISIGRLTHSVRAIDIGLDIL